MNYKDFLEFLLSQAELAEQRRTVEEEKPVAQEPVEKEPPTEEMLVTEGHVTDVPTEWRAITVEQLQHLEEKLKQRCEDEHWVNPVEFFGNPKDGHGNPKFNQILDPSEINLYQLYIIYKI